MNNLPLAKLLETSEPIRRLMRDGFRASSWVRGVSRGVVPRQETEERDGHLNPERAQPEMVMLRRKTAYNPTARYDDLARRRVTLLACRYGGPALEVGTGPCACMAQRLARCGMRLTAVDLDAAAVRSAEQAVAAPALKGRVKVQQADACHLPFEAGSFRVVVAFDCLGHARKPKQILAEMFRVCSHDGVVLATEYNEPGRRGTQHRKFGFEERLEKLIAAHCVGCRRIDHPHHVTYVCDETTRQICPSPAVETVPIAITN